MADTKNLLGETTTKNYISCLKLPNGNVVYIKDTEAWAKLLSIAGTVTSAMQYVGITTTELTDGAEVGTIVITGTDHTAVAGDVAIYGELEFVYNGSKWQELGSSGSLKALAFKDSATSDVTTWTGTADAQTFTGKEATLSVGINNAEVTSTGKVTVEGSSKISVGSGEANYTPEGSVSAPTVTLSTTTHNSLKVKTAGSVTAGSADTFTQGTDQFVAPSLGNGFYTAGEDGTVPTLTKSNHSIVGISGTVGTASAGTAANWAASLDETNPEMLNISWTANTPTGQGSIVTAAEAVTATEITDWSAGTMTTTAKVDITKFNAGSFTQGNDSFTAGTVTEVTLPTFENDTITYANGVESVTAPTFTGTAVDLESSWTANEATIEVKGTTAVTANDITYTPEGTNAASNATVSGQVTVS